MTFRRVLAALTAMVLLTACGPKSHLAVRLRDVSITSPRLLTPAIELVAPSNVTVSLPSVPPVATLLPRDRAPSRLPDCPPADVFAVANLPVNQIVSSPPTPDSFTQASDGRYSSTAATGSLAGSVSVAVAPLPAATSSVGQRIDAWSVQRTDHARKATSVEVYQLVYPSSSTGATASGIYLVGLAWDDPVRGTLRFQSVGTGLFILPSPAQPSTSDAQYVGAGTDPATLTTLELTRNVRGHKQVDACGKLIDTLTVEMSGTLTSTTEQRQVVWTQQWATAYGAAEAEETLSLTSLTDGFTWTRTLRDTALPKELS